jgi:hypothetical protein
MRTKGAETKKLCWNILIKQGDTELHNKDYKTLRLAADDLGLTYSQICELGPSGRCKKKAIKFKFMPEIVISKIAPIQVDNHNPNHIPHLEGTFESENQE